MAIGNEIRNQLKARGKSVAWLAEQTGIPASTLRSLISRDSWSIKPETLDKICDALEIFPSQLTSDNDLRAEALASLAAKCAGFTITTSSHKDASIYMIEGQDVSCYRNGQQYRFDYQGWLDLGTELQDYARYLIEKRGEK